MGTNCLQWNSKQIVSVQEAKQSDDKNFVFVVETNWKHSTSNHHNFVLVPGTTQSNSKYFVPGLGNKPVKILSCLSSFRGEAHPPVAGDLIKWDPRYALNPIYSSIFANNIWSYLPWFPVVWVLCPSNGEVLLKALQVGNTKYYWRLVVIRTDQLY